MPRNWLLGTVGGRLGRLADQRLGGPPAGSPVGVDQAAAGEGEDPRPEGVVAAHEAGDQSCDLGPHVGCDVLRLPGVGHPQVAQQGRVQLPVERVEVGAVSHIDVVGAGTPLLTTPCTP
jgi:hypothetical protein